MPITFEEAFTRATKLVADFDAKRNYHMAPVYKEAQARKDFIDKFWIILGWDVNHDTQTNPYEQEVKVEVPGEGEARGRSADYAFCVAPNFRDVHFFVEAKKPSVTLKTADNYFQTQRYGWAGGPLSVLTDFEEFHILDCRFKPDIDSALNGWSKTYQYSDYAKREKFAEIFYLFGREAVLDGSIEKFAAQNLPKRSGGKQRGPSHGGSLSLDEDFLNTLDEFRTALACSFKKQNPQLDAEALTEATQRVLDRLVFMRFLEDKLIEPEHLIANFGNKGSHWQDFVAQSRRLDRIYNGIVFKDHFVDQPNFEADDGVFGNICDELASNYSPYNFNTIPIHILGSIYERFLGKVIEVEGEEARLTLKPEIRKAGGVYYTPQYIVHYIVEQTVGSLVSNKTPEELITPTGAVKIADIACGSGSFLLGVYDYLLNYCAAFYNKKSNRTKARKAGCIERDGLFHLSLLQRRELLLNNIYGVDIDAQAVEVTQLSLFLKLLEEETTASAREHQHVLPGALLPSLTSNIKCGNSLIGRDIIAPAVERRHINPMNFEDAFPEIMKQGGFNAIVGNPPYIRIQGFPKLQIHYFSHRFDSAVGNYDIYVNFVERGYKVLRDKGKLGFIVPNKFFKTDYGEGLRGLISEHKAVSAVVDFGAEQVFEATTYTCLLFLTKSANAIVRYSQIPANAEALLSVKFTDLNSETLNRKAWLFTNDRDAQVHAKLSQNSVRLLDLPADMSRGSSSGNDKVFVIDKNELEIEKELLRIPVFASNFNRYQFGPTQDVRIIFPYRIEGDSASLFSEQELKEKFPQAYAYLLSNKELLESRKQFAQWYGYSAPRNLSLHDRAQIIVPLLANKGLFSLYPSAARQDLCPMASGGFTITLGTPSLVKPQYVLGLINSRLLFWHLERMSNIFRGGWITCTKQYFGELPIRVIDFKIKADKARHDEMVRLVEAIIEAKQQLAAALTERDINFYKGECDSLDRQIDVVVYDLYELTDEEIALVEAG